MFGGNSKTDLGGIPDSVDRNAANFSGRLYMHGDDGDDEMWGKNNMEEEYFWGGEDDDFIRPGSEANIIIAMGNDGDDILYSAVRTIETEKLLGGKGDDKINPIELAFDSNGDVDVDNTNWIFDLSEDYNYGTATITYKGEDGDDEIWGPSKTYGDEMYLLGGNGNDIIYNPYLRYGTTVASGGGDKDIIRFDTYDSVDNY